MIIRNAQEAFNYIHSLSVMADDPTSDAVREKMYSNIFAMLHAFSLVGVISQRQRMDANEAVRAAYHDSDREQLDLLGAAL